MVSALILENPVSKLATIHVTATGSGHESSLAFTRVLGRG